MTPDTRNDDTLNDTSMKYEDLTPMPFGMHKGKPLQEVPAKYIHWLWTQRPMHDQNLEDYIRANLPALKQEFPDGIWS